MTMFAAISILSAVSLTVTAGEHGDYSRIVIAGGKVVAVDRAQRAVDIRVDDASAPIDLSDINDKRKAHRVVAAQRMATAQGAVVRLTLSCDCSIEAKAAVNGNLVIDIRDDARAAPPAPPAAPAKPKTALVEDEEDSLDEARTRMIELLRRAADEGFITIRDDSSDLAPPRETAVASIPIPVEAPPTMARAPRDCLDDAAFAIDGAAFDAEPLIAISDLQKELGAAGAARQDEIIHSLVDGYLSIGFGDEAYVLLSGSGESESVRADLARVVADRDVEADGPLLGGGDCRGAQALWQAAAGDENFARLAVKRADDAAADLPKRLRALIATRIAKKLILAGDWEEARKYYAIAGAASEIPTGELQFVAAKLLEQEGRAEDAERMLKDLAAGNTQASKDALLALAARYAAGETPHEGFIEDIGALAKTDRGAAAGADAAFREAMAWAAAGNIEASILLLRNATGGAIGHGGAASAKAKQLLADAFASPDEKMLAAALSAYLENRDFIDSGAEPAFRRSVAETATRLGLPHVALRVMRDPKTPADSKDAAALSRAALAAGDGEAALAAAAPYADDPSFAPLIVEANLKLAHHTAALAAASSLSNPGDRASMAALAAWRAGDWASASRAFQKIDPKTLNEESAKHYAFAAYMAGEKFIPPAAEAVLKNEESAAYAGLKALFAAPPSGPIVDRSRSIVDGAAEEIKLIEEILDHG